MHTLCGTGSVKVGERQASGGFNAMKKAAAQLNK
jgi:hypothetical protein